jgi:diguanylate cyclase (GGDEF)-like protein
MQGHPGAPDRQAPLEKSGMLMRLPAKYLQTAHTDLQTTALFVLALAMGATILVLTAKLARSRKTEIHLHQAIAAMQAAENTLKEQAYFDYLTGLPNRALLADRFHLAIERSKRSRDPFAVVMIDLNNFKSINDRHGHAAGDEVLVIMGKRLLDTVRASDTVSRLGGDEFVLVIESIGDRSELARIGQKLIDMLSEKVELECGAVVSLGGSLGFALYPADGSTMESMLQVADQAMYDCKTSGMVPLF